MKTTLRTALIAGLLCCSPTFAQTGVPSEMSYQAIVTDDNNALIAPSAAISYEVTVRIYSAATGGTLLWAEQHVTDIFQGRLSITLGQGVAVPKPGGGTEPWPDLATVFNQEDRFTEITVRKNDPGEPSKTLAPRQKLVASATAFRARVAEVANSVAPNSLPANAIANGSLNGDIFNNGAVNSVKIGTGVISNTEFNYLNGVTSGIQAQLNSKASITQLNSKASITQLNGKADQANPLFTGSVNVNGYFKNTQTGANAPENGTNGGVGQRLVLFPGSSTRTPYGFGIDSSTLWSCVREGAHHKWYEGTTERMRLEAGGELGLGTASPKAELHIYGTSNPTIKIQSNGDDEVSGRLSMRQNNDTGFDVYYDGRGGSSNEALKIESFASGVSNGVRMTIKQSNGSVGIGTVNPSSGKLHIAGGVIRDAPGLDGDRSFSLWADHNIASDQHYNHSDARIKVVKGVSDSGADLAVLNSIEVTNYTYKDTANKGQALNKKVIAQQVEKVFPQVVSQMRNTVPDIYQRAEINDGWIKLETDLKVGERVALSHGQNERVIYEVSAVEPGRFRASFDAPSDLKELFVFGREVDDFRSVDYDGIAMLNVSATQELHRRLEAKEKEVEVLTARLELMDAKLVAIEKLLSGKAPAARTVSK